MVVAMDQWRPVAAALDLPGNRLFVPASLRSGPLRFRGISGCIRPQIPVVAAAGSQRSALGLDVVCGSQETGYGGTPSDSVSGESGRAENLRDGIDALHHMEFSSDGAAQGVWVGAMARACHSLRSPRIGCRSPDSGA